MIKEFVEEYISTHKLREYAETYKDLLQNCVKMKEGE